MRFSLIKPCNKTQILTISTIKYICKRFFLFLEIFHIATQPSYIALNKYHYYINHLSSATLRLVVLCPCFSAGLPMSTTYYIFCNLSSVFYANLGKNRAYTILLYAKRNSVP